MNICDIIENELTSHDAKERSKHKKREPGIFYPSESLQCQRKIYIDVIHPDWKKKTMPLGLFHMAKLAERSIIDCIKATPYLSVQEQIGIKTKIYPDILLHGYADFGLLTEEGRYSHICEIKSINNISYINKLTEPKSHHKSQLQCYLQSLKCTQGSVLYTERGDIFKTKQFDEMQDDILWNKIKTHFLETYQYMEDANLPPPIPVEKWECDYCEFNDKCKKERKQLNIKVK